MNKFLRGLQDSMANIFQLRVEWLDWLWSLGNPELLLQVALVFVLLLLGRYIYDRATPFSLAEVLTTRDNKALSSSFACYLGGLIIVIVGVYSSPSVALTTGLPYWRYLVYSLSDTFFWGLIAICLLLLAQVLNNHLILSRFDNYTQIVEHRNLAAGIAEGASYIASSLLIYAVMQGISDSFLLDILLTLFYFTLGQFILILYSRVFIATRRKVWDFHREIGQKNTAAAISFSFSFISFSLLLSAYIAHFDSIYGLLLAAIFDMVFILLLHVLIDQLFFPKVSLHQEIAADQNWGAALIEGFLLLGFCAICVIAFSFYLT